MSVMLTHKIGHNLAHGCAEDEVLQDVGNKGEGHTEDANHQVADSQRQQEGVGDGPHALVQHQDQDDQQVAKDTEEKDEHVEHDAQRVHLWRKETKTRGRDKKSFIMSFVFAYTSFDQ